MSCPNCKIQLECPCENCQKWRKKDGKVEVLLWEWIDGETMGCPICGFTEHADIWQDYELEEFDESRRRGNEEKG